MNSIQSKLVAAIKDAFARGYKLAPGSFDANGAVCVIGALTVDVITGTDERIRIAATRLDVTPGYVLDIIAGFDQRIPYHTHTVGDAYLIGWELRERYTDTGT